MNIPTNESEVTQSQSANRDRFTLERLMDISSDIDHQPDWRTNANTACAYYDGDQLAPEVVAKLRERGQPLTQHNLIAPTIDGVLGMEAKTRTDLMVIADDPNEEMEVMAEAVNAEFADACRLQGLGQLGDLLVDGAGFESRELRCTDGQTIVMLEGELHVEAGDKSFTAGEGDVVECGGEGVRRCGSPPPALTGPQSGAPVVYARGSGTPPEAFWSARSRDSAASR